MKLKNDTQPITNVLGKNKDYLSKYLEEYLSIYGMIRPNKLVAFHKERLGKQLTCFNGEFRYWVWEGSVAINKYHTVKWRVFVSNHKGIGFEVNTGREQAAMLCWEDYKNKMSA